MRRLCPQVLNGFQYCYRAATPNIVGLIYIFLYECNIAAILDEAELEFRQVSSKADT
jgi:hypothetical protein